MIDLIIRQMFFFLSVQEDRVSLVLYIDDFEVCNPLGTSRNKHKVTAVYWLLANIPGHLRSTLASISLAIPCKAEDTKQFGFHSILEPLLTDIQSLEKDVLFCSSDRESHQRNCGQCSVRSFGGRLWWDL